MGICHQTANQILIPANVTVSEASGYAYSVFLYGTYGFQGDIGIINRRTESCGMYVEHGEYDIYPTFQLPLKKIAKRLTSKR